MKQTRNVFDESELAELNEIRPMEMQTKAPSHSSTAIPNDILESADVSTEFSFILKPSTIHGVGVFAAHPINAGTILRLFPVSEDVRHLVSVPPAFEQYVVAQDSPEIMCPVDFGRMAIGWHLNHSNFPNVDIRAGYEYVAATRINEGDELTIDYRKLDGCADFSSLRAAPESLQTELEALLARYTEPCVTDCEHAHCPLLRELRDIVEPARISAALEKARQVVKPLIDREKEGEWVGDIMKMRLDAAALAASPRDKGETAMVDVYVKCSECFWLGKQSQLVIKLCPKCGSSLIFLAAAPLPDKPTKI